MAKIKIGSKIRELRRAQNLTMRQLAELLGVSHTAISLWESGRREPDVSTIMRISEIFYVSVDELLDSQADYLQMKFPRNENVVSVLGRNGTSKTFILDDSKISAVASFAETLAKESDK